MKVRRAIVSFGLITLVYLLVLVWLDSRNQNFIELTRLTLLLPVMIGLSFVSYLVRYVRWYWLLIRAGSKTNLTSGFLAYLAGFAFTATPGKLGELVRIRYLIPQGVPPWKVLAAFIYERAFDLIAVLFLSALAINQNKIFFFIFAFVVISISALVIISLNLRWLSKLLVYMRFYQLTRLSRMCKILRDGLSGCRVWLTVPDILVSMTLGIVAWSVLAYSFLLLLSHLHVSIPALSAISIYPLSMLAGAASMIPGGIGSTETSIVVLLSFFDVQLETALLAAVGIRLSSMWFAIICGFIAMGVMEFIFHRNAMLISRKH